MHPCPATPTVRSQIVAPVLGLLRSGGCDVAGLLARLGLPAHAETERHFVLPLAKLHALLDAAERASGDPFLGIHVAARLPRGTFDILEFSCHSAPTVREALRRVARYSPLVNPAAVLTFEERGGAGLVEQRVPGAPLCLGRHANECFVAMLLRKMRKLSGAPVVPVRAWFAHPAPRDTSALVELLGTTHVAFDVGAVGLALSDATLDLPLQTADPELLSVLDHHAAWSLSASAPPADLVGKVRGLVAARLGDGAPEIDLVARELGMSSRTLQRRLMDEGTTYHEVIDALRREMAGAWVRHTELPLADIAARLGYREPGAFLRAFKRWHGVAASRLRRKAPADPGGVR